MKPQTSLTLIVSAFFVFQQSSWAADGSWSQAGGGNQDWLNTANWLNSVYADGIDANAIVSVNLTADQSITNAGGRTVGHMFFQDTDTGTAGGFNVGGSADAGSLTLDVSSGRSIFNV